MSFNMELVSADKNCSLKARDEVVDCLMCDTQLSIVPNNQPFLKHLLTVHKIVIAECENIPDFKSYVSYWQERLKGRKLEQFCPVICTNSESPMEEQEYYYLLCDSLPEDKSLRKNLQMKRLENILNVLQKERTECEFTRGCLFCKKHFSGNKQEILNHLSFDHNLHLGHPDNIVFVEEYLDLIENKLENCQCLYCEKVFKDKIVLKEHMRKKLHKQINPNNPQYDKFYVVNYLEAGKSWRDLDNDEDEEEEDEDLSQEVDFSDWLETQDKLAKLSCLFCNHHTHEIGQLYSHLLAEHQFDFKLLKQKYNLSFYDQIKLVNYIRSEVMEGRCPHCGSHFMPSLEKHTAESHHCDIPDRKLWDQYQYYFPTKCDDELLNYLEDD